MKKLIVSIATALMLVTFTPIQSRAAEKEPPSISTTGKESPEVKALIDRVNEIKAMDRSTMSRAEKKEIRKELRALKREVNRHGGDVVVVSTGLLIVILILIIVF